MFRKQVAVTQKFRTDCCMHSPSWDSRPRHHTLCHICLLVSICHCGRMPRHKPLKALGTKKLWFSKSNKLKLYKLFPARVLFLLLYQSQAPCCLGVVLRQCPPDTGVSQNISLQKQQIGNVLFSLFCSWLPLILVT